MVQYENILSWANPLGAFLDQQNNYSITCKIVYIYWQLLIGTFEGQWYTTEQNNYNDDNNNSNFF